MKSKLRAKVVTASRRNSTSKAVVIDVAISRASVRLGGNGAVLTMIPVSGSVSVGDTVIVDYSNGAPLVKAII